MDALDERGEQLVLRRPAGELRFDAPDDAIIERVGEELLALLRRARDEGKLAKLPLTDGCRLSVEDLDGCYGVDDYIDGREHGEPSPEQRFERLRAEIAGLGSERKQVNRWIRELTALATGQPCALEPLAWGEDWAFEQLVALGQPALLPTLKLVERFADQPEWLGDRPRRNIEEASWSDVAFRAVGALREIGARVELSRPARRKLEQRLVAVLRAAVAANAGRRLWGALPYHLALTLHELFDYPEPRMDARSNALKQPERFTG